jgi:hypothetical protein
MKESGNRERVDLQELYADAALSLAVVPEARRGLALEHMSQYLAARPEVWEHPDRQAQPPAGYGKPDTQLVEEVRARIVESMDYLQQTPLMRLMPAEMQAASAAAAPAFG